MKRIIGILLLGAMLLTGCTQSSGYEPSGDGLSGDLVAQPTNGQQEQEQQFSLVYNPLKSLNPYSCADFTNRALFSLLYQSLFVVDKDYNVEPQLCKSYTVSQDKKTYVFYLEQATFSDGTELTVGDVMVSLEAARTSPVYSGRLGNVDSISITADDGLQVVLKTAYDNFPLLLNIPIVMASQVELDAPDGTGPYSLENTTAGYQLCLRQDWWCKAELAVHAQEIPLVTAQTAKQIRDEFELGDVGIVCANPGADSYVDFRSNYNLWDCENGVFLYLGCREKSKVFSNEAVRQALTHAIDRSSLVKDYYRTFALAATLPASPNSPYYNDALAAQYGYDAEKFKAVLIQEGLEESSIVLLVNKEDSRRVKVAQAIAAMLEECSLKVTVKSVSGDAYISALKYGSFDLHLGQTMLSPNMDLSAFYDKNGTLSYGGMGNTSIAALCKDALANASNYDRLHQAVMEDAVLCPVAFLSYAVYVKSGLVENLAPARDCIFYYSLGKTMEDAQIKE